MTKKEKVIVAVLMTIVLVMAGITVTKIQYDVTHFVGYIIEESGETFDDGFARGTVWTNTGVSRTYSIDELRGMAKDKRVGLTGVISGEVGIAFRFTEGGSVALFIPGLSFDSGVAEHYYLTF